MKKGICYIVGAGDWFDMDFRPAKNDFVIAADAGLRYLEQVGIPADLVIGDFDTLEEIPTGANVVRLSCEKDDTDMLAAVREGIKAGYKEFHIYGGTGGRIDHTLANLQVLAYLAGNGMQGFLHCPQNVLLRPVDAYPDLDRSSETGHPRRLYDGTASGKRQLFSGIFPAGTGSKENYGSVSGAADH